MNEAEVTASESPTSKRPKKNLLRQSLQNRNQILIPKLRFHSRVSNRSCTGNGAVAHVMEHVCDGGIGYPITPSTEISEIYEAYRASGGINVWDRRPYCPKPKGSR